MLKLAIGEVPESLDAFICLWIGGEGKPSHIYLSNAAPGERMTTYNGRPGGFGVLIQQVTLPVVIPEDWDWHQKGSEVVDKEIQATQAESQLLVTNLLNYKSRMLELTYDAPVAVAQDPDKDIPF